jgi:transcription antitermination factor NusB
MSARRIARELAVIVMPQLPKNKEKLSSVDLEDLVAKAVHMLRDYAKQILSDANSVLLASTDKINEIELNHPKNADKIEDISAVPLTTGQLKLQIDGLERALNMVAEALDIPDMALSTGRSVIDVQCGKCGEHATAYIDRPNKSDVQQFFVRLVSAYLEHRDEIDEFIKNARAKWQVERMVSIDRDILRLACAEALYMPDVPVNVCISEAVELCHRFADERAAKFINGILGDLSKQARYFRAHGRLAQEVVEESGESAEEVLELDDQPIKQA